MSAHTGPTTKGRDGSTTAAPDQASDPQAHYHALLEELDRPIQAIRAAALELKAAAGGIQAVECNVDRLLASTTMLEINVSDALGRDRPMAGWTGDDSRL